ncbi:MAG: amidohydrolase family protein, partial [Rhodospirillaceae bacterium]|nr:amidohydrolase family protein [Rhodospirillaceae bacterium]
GWYPGERLTAEEAIRGYTSWAAFAGFDEQEAGTITVGKRADLTVIDVDPFRIAAPNELLAGAVQLTVSRGRVTYRRSK